jgi:hypothetical protein
VRCGRDVCSVGCDWDCRGVGVVFVVLDVVGFGGVCGCGLGVGVIGIVGFCSVGCSVVWV